MVVDSSFAMETRIKDSIYGLYGHFMSLMEARADPNGIFLCFLADVSQLVQPSFSTTRLATNRSGGQASETLVILQLKLATAHCDVC